MSMACTTHNHAQITNRIAKKGKLGEKEMKRKRETERDREYE